MFNLMKLTNLGMNSALKIRKEIITDLEDKGYKLPCGLIPTCEVGNKLNININYLQNSRLNNNIIETKPTILLEHKETSSDLEEKSYNYEEYEIVKPKNKDGLVL